MARRRALPPSRCNKSEAKGKTATLSSKRGAERHVQAIAAGKLYRDKRGHFNLRNLLDMHVQSTLIYWTGEEKRRERERVKRRPIRRENRIDIEAGHGEGTTCAGQPTKGTTLLSLSLSLIGSCQYLSVSGNRAMNRNVINYLLHTTGQSRRQISSVSRANAAAMHAPYNPSHPRSLAHFHSVFLFLYLPS